MLNYSVNHARSESNSCSASTAPLAHFDLAASSGILLLPIFIVFRGLQANVNQLRNRPEQPANADAENHRPTDRADFDRL
jgi:hypothetical protein